MAAFQWNISLTDSKMMTGPKVPAIVVPAGIYYIGDPCYAIGDSPIYEKVWADTG
jgi:hypothetical protein